jgi:hypothetical protein
MVPVIDQNGKALFPCKERRARTLLARGEAVNYWQKGIFCIKLIRKETEKREEYPDIALGIDPGSKREGYTVATPKDVVLNITTNTPDWIESHVETRRNLRRSRRQRKTPYRACRKNRSCQSKTRIPPSTKARWDAKLRIIKILNRILPVTKINCEDIKAITNKNKKRWNRSFSPLEVGKSYFYNQLKKLYPTTQMMITSGKGTSAHRKSRGFAKSTNKLAYTWDAHNSDSHSLAEIALNENIYPYKGLYQINFLEFHRRQLHVQNPAKGGVRKEYGTTVSLDMSRGSVVRYTGKNKEHSGKLFYLGGSSKGKIEIKSIITGARVYQFTNPRDIKVMYRSIMRTQFLPRHEGGGILAETK